MAEELSWAERQLIQAFDDFVSMSSSEEVRASLLKVLDTAVDQLDDEEARRDCHRYRRVGTNTFAP